MKKIVMSSFVVLAVAAIAGYATYSYFSDTETSTGNTFTAGAVDLTVSSTGTAEGATCTFNNGAVEGQALLACTDVKPGDSGETTLKFNIQSNPVYACLNVSNVVDSDVTCVEPEMKAETGCTSTGNGELDDAIALKVWIDDGVGTNGVKCDNILNGTEQVVYEGSLAAITGNLPEGSIMIAGPSGLRTAAIPAGEQCLGVEWNVPTTVGNAAQTDSFGADLSFYVEQSRNNENFVCPGAALPEATVIMETGWSEVDLDSNGGGAGKEWFAKARNNNGGFEVAVGINSAGDALRNDANTTWIAGAVNPFTLSYDGAGKASFTAGGQTVNYTVGTTGYGRIGINVKAPSTVTTTVNSLSLDVAGPLSTDNVSVTGAGNTVKHLTISGINLDQAWTLMGNFIFSDVGAAYVDEYPAVQFSID